ncbi:MAG: cobalamin B12-binding domain-containing protein [Planctomycetes bacterium]|nr:cobalamin B12-binding domain-containing protein [Planctomycetota bacterium]
MTEAHGLAEAISLCQEDTVKKLLKEKLEAGVPAAEIVVECNQGMVELGNRFGREECFIPDLMFGGMIMKGVMAELGPMLSPGDVPAAEAKAKVVMGTVQHDVHDIGKDIVIMMLRGVGFEVIDLGIDVAPEKYVEAVREHDPAVVGISLLLTTCFGSVTATVDALREAGLREKVAIMVGGAAASELLRENTGCDFYGKSAVDGLNYACQVADVG